MKRSLHSIIGIIPMLFAVWCVCVPRVAHCQSPADNPSNKSAVDDSKSPDGTPAKVWTNDNIDEVRSNHAVSTVGRTAGVKKTDATKASSNRTATATEIQNYRKQLATLRADIEKLDSQIQTTKAFIDGENVGGTQPVRRSQPGNPEDQLLQFEQKRQADLAKIDSVMDFARRKGIEPGALR